MSKSFCTLGSPVTGGDRGQIRILRGECSNRSMEGKAERISHRGVVPTSTPQPETLVCMLGLVGAGC